MQLTHFKAHSSLKSYNKMKSYVNIFSSASPVATDKVYIDADIYFYSFIDSNSSQTEDFPGSAFTIMVSREVNIVVNILK